MTIINMDIDKLQPNESTKRKSGYEPDADRLRVSYEALETNPEHAILELKVLASIGSAMAPLYLGWIYQSGEVVTKDDAEAERWLKLSLERGQKLASYYLGHFYLRQARKSDAVETFKQGSKLGSMSSKYCLAMAIQDGMAGTPDPDRVKQLLTEASEDGHVFAMRSLASIYLSGSFGMFGRLRGMALLIRAVITGAFYAAKAPDDERLRA